MIKDKGTKAKITLVLTLFIFFGVSIIAKLYMLQVKNHDELHERALSQYKGRLYEYANRGNILDRNMRELALNVEVNSVYANPKKVTHPRQTAGIISSITGITKKEIYRKLKQKSPFVYIKRKITPDEYEKLKDKNLPGIKFSKEYKRFYPKMELAARTIGFAGMDNQGLSGIEYAFDKHLSQGGKWIRYQKDRRGRNVEISRVESNYYSEGSNLVLSIDEVLQHYALKAVEKKVIETKAKRGLSIVMEPATGEILAIAEYPFYNANSYQNFSLGQTKNRIISDAFEPGSTFKLILAAAALEDKIAQPKDIFFCENGAFDIGGIVIHEASRKKYRWLTFEEIIKKSSNIGSVKIARRLGKERYFKYIKKFGFGEKTGIDLPGEAKGLVRDPSQWSNVSIGSIAIGQEISTTPLQLITAISAIANGGYLMKPIIVKQIIHNGRVTKKFPPKIVRKVISSETVETMKHILVQTVENGTGIKAAIDGYSVGGKTGTAQKIDPETKRYSSEKYVASFVGFAPIENPRLAILVIIDEPKGLYWGGSVAAPVFREIAIKALRHMKVPSKENRFYSLPARPARSDKETFTISNKSLKLNSGHTPVIKIIKENLNENLDRLIAGLKKYFWEADRAIAQSRI